MRKLDPMDSHAIERVLKGVADRKRSEISRRKFLHKSAMAVGAGLATQFLPNTVFADVSGQVTHFSPAGKRLSNALEAVRPLFNKVYPNVDVKVVSQPTSDALTNLNTYMRAKSDAYDVATHDHSQFASLHAMGALTDLGPFLSNDSAWYDDYKSDVPESYRNMWNVPKGSAPPGYVAGLAPDCNAMMSFYRQDVFDKAGLKLPVTWDEVIDVCKEIHDPANERYAYCAAMARNFWAGYQYYGALRSWGGDYFADEFSGDYTVTIETEEAYQALKYLVELQKYAHPVSSNAGEDEVNQSFANGSALFSPLSWGTAVLNDSSFTDLHEVWNFGASPKGTLPKSEHRALTGGFGQFLPTWGDNKEAAFAWTKFINSGDREDVGGSPMIADAIVGAGGQLSRTSTLTRWADRKPFFVGLMGALKYAVVNAPVIPEAFNIQGVVGEEIADAVNLDKSVEDALSSCQKKVTRIMEDAGYY